MAQLELMALGGTMPRRKLKSKVKIGRRVFTSERVARAVTREYGSQTVWIVGYLENSAVVELPDGRLTVASFRNLYDEDGVPFKKTSKNDRSEAVKTWKYTSYISIKGGVENGIG